MRHIFPLTNRYASILVPDDLPIRIGSFVEEDAAYCKAFRLNLAAPDHRAPQADIERQWFTGDVVV